jgi:hypothetical protein
MASPANIISIDPRLFEDYFSRDFGPTDSPADEQGDDGQLCFECDLELREKAVMYASQFRNPAYAGPIYLFLKGEQDSLPVRV